MSDSKLSCSHISIAVGHQLSLRNWSLRECAEAFNEANLADIEQGKIRLMTKDVVHRVRKNDFEVINDRVAELCNFLNIDIQHSPKDKARDNASFELIEEFEVVERIIQRKPELRKTIKSFLNNLATVAGYRE